MATISDSQLFKEYVRAQRKNERVVTLKKVFKAVSQLTTYDEVLAYVADFYDKAGDELEEKSDDGEDKK